MASEGSSEPVDDAVAPVGAFDLRAEVNTDVPVQTHRLGVDGLYGPPRAASTRASNSANLSSASIAVDCLCAAETISSPAMGASRILLGTATTFLTALFLRGAFVIGVPFVCLRAQIG